MTLDYTVIAEHDLAFTVVVVPKPVLSDPAGAKRTIAFFEWQYFRMPTVLIACADRELPSSYYGRTDSGLPPPPRRARRHVLAEGGAPLAARPMAQAIVHENVSCITSTFGMPKMA